MARRWLPPDNPNPFQSVMLEYMWSQRPPLDIARLAERLDIPATTVHGWFYAQRLPHASTLRQVATMTGIPYAELLRAAGYETAGQPSPPTFAFPPTLWDALERAALAYPGLDGNARHAFFEFVRAGRAGQLDQFAAEREAEHRVPVEPVKPAKRDTATDTQQEQPKQATRSRPRRRRDSAHRAPSRP